MAIGILLFIAITGIAVAWVFIDDAEKRKNARRMRPRPVWTSDAESDSYGEQPAGERMTIVRHSSPVFAEDEGIEAFGQDSSQDASKAS